MKVTRGDVLDALERARGMGCPVVDNPRLSHSDNFAAIMQACDDAGQEALKRHTFVLCDCCTHDVDKLDSQVQRRPSPDNNGRPSEPQRDLAAP